MKNSKRIHKSLAFVLSLLMLFLLIPSYTLICSASGSTVLTVNLTSGGKTINNLFNHVGTWYTGGQWAGVDEDSLITKFPFVEYSTLHAATGGTSVRDLYVDPDDPSQGMTFTEFNAQLDRHLAQGVIPYIKIGSVPSCLCNDAAAGAMGTNKRPPTTSAQWTQYYNYVAAIAQNVVDTYGLSTARSWKWGCFSEANNEEWFETSDENAINTRNAYFKLYDYTVAALQSVLGTNQFTVGTHLLGCLPSEHHPIVKWDELDFIDHCAFGMNYYTGGTGTQLNFIAISRYDNKPGDSTNIRSFTEAATRLKNRAIADGLSIGVGVDEYGQIADHNGVELIGSRSVGYSWETSKVASDYKELLLAGYDYVTNWALASSYGDVSRYLREEGGIHTEGIAGARLNQANVAELVYKMVGSTLQATNKSGTPANANDDVDAVSAFNNSTRKTYILVFNHNENGAATDSEDVTITINNIAANSGSTVTVNKYVLDSTHSNWFNTWWSDRGSTAPNIWSPYDVVYPHTLVNSSDRDYWNSHESSYELLSEIGTPTTTILTPSNNSITLTPTLTHHSVVLYEITNSKMAATVSNQALGAAVSASSVESGGYTISAINDNVSPQYQYPYQWSSSTTTMPEWAQLDFNDDVTFNRVELFMPANGYWMQGYKIQYYWNGTWYDATPAITDNTNAHRTHIFPAVTCSKMRVYCTSGDSLSGHARINEIMLYNDITPTANKSIGAIASASSTYQGSLPIFDPSYANDGYTGGYDGSTTGMWSAANVPSSQSPEYLIQDFGMCKTINQIDVYFPSWVVTQDYQIKYYDGSNWNVLATITNNTTAHRTHSFNRVTATKVQISVTRGESISGYTYVAELSASDTADTSTVLSNKVTNPGFETDGKFSVSPFGWSTSGTDTDADAAEITVGQTYPGRMGYLRMTHWKATAYQVYTYQTISRGLTDGYYTLSAWVRSDFGGLGTAYMKAEGYGGVDRTYNIPTTSMWQQITIKDINVTNGQCTIGFYSNSPSGGRWYVVDDVTLTKQ